MTNDTSNDAISRAEVLRLFLEKRTADEFTDAIAALPTVEPAGQPWKCACGWTGTPAQMTVSNALRTCPKCGASGGLILDEPSPTNSARRAADALVDAWEREWCPAMAHAAYLELKTQIAAAILRHGAGGEVLPDAIKEYAEGKSDG